MSATATIKTKATNRAIVERMCRLAGWGEVRDFPGRQNYVQFSTVVGQEPMWNNRIWINLSTGEVNFDGDYGSLRKIANEIRDHRYETASVIYQAEEAGYTWEMGEPTSEGFPVVYVEYPDTEMEVSYG